MTGKGKGKTDRMTGGEKRRRLSRLEKVKRGEKGKRKAAGCNRKDGRRGEMT